MSDCYSPELSLMNKDSGSFHYSGTYTSPSTPDYRDSYKNGFEKGWASERVPLTSNGNQRRTSVNVLMPFNNGRTLPSKWDDAERWITSPPLVSASGVCKNLDPPPQRQPKAKSGPLGPTPSETYFSGCSPGFGVGEGRSRRNLFVESPFTTGVLVPNGYSFCNGDRIDQHPVLGHTEYRLATLELSDSSYSGSQDEKIEENNVSYAVSRRDMGTQMSRESSLKERPLLLLSSPPKPSMFEPHNRRSGRREVDDDDVQVDKRVTMIRIPKRHTKIRKKNGPIEMQNRTEGVIELSKVQKEEARITAWENLQNAKAEASIQKLEMKLEKKKSASMEKIMKKLRVSQMKAQEMRKSISVNQSPKTSRKVMSLYRYPMIPLTRCFCSRHS
ncbi:uncharacterized protein [Rutidosis leptorrhynchoides]|uniref:uncharacterized protein n=1 Tax=Rutidosis leptorrhynchoides TaxID=125765 RepID=UPI003A9A32B5